MDNTWRKREMFHPINAFKIYKCNGSSNLYGPIFTEINMTKYYVFTSIVLTFWISWNSLSNGGRSSSRKQYCSKSRQNKPPRLKGDTSHCASMIISTCLYLFDIHRQWYMHHPFLWYALWWQVSASGYPTFKLKRVQLKDFRFDSQISLHAKRYMINYKRYMVNYDHCEVCSEIIYQFPNFSACNIEVCKRISNLTPHYIMDVITYPCLD